MSLSHKSSFETVVVEKVRDDFQSLTKPLPFRKELDLKGLSDSASKSFTSLKRWQQAAVCQDHPLAHATINKLSELSNESYHATELTLTIAQKGQLLATNVVAFYDALNKKDSSLEYLDTLLSKLNTIAEKGYGRSIEAHGRLICLCAGLSKISENIPSLAAKIEEDVLKSSVHDPYTPANGMNATFLTIPTAVYQAPRGLSGYRNSFGSGTDSDDEDAIGSNSTSFGRQPYLPYPRENWYTYQNVSTQLDLIGGDLSKMIEYVGQCITWWGKMKANLETLKSNLATIVQDDPRSLHMLNDDMTDGWNDIADQFALYVYKTSPILLGFYPYVGPRIYSPPPQRAYSPPLVRPVSPPSRGWSPPPMLPPVNYPYGGTTIIVPDSGPTDSSPKSFWKKLSCIS